MRQTGQVLVAGEPVDLVDERDVALGARERDELGDAVGDVAADVLAGGVDGVGRHDAVGRVLAAGDRDEARLRAGDGVLARQLAGVLALAGQQGPQAGVDALDVVVGQRHLEHGVDVLEDVVDVGAGRRRVGQVEVPVGVGRADDPVRAPRDDEEHRLLGAQDEPGLGVDPVAGDDDVHALGGAHVEAAAAAGHRLDVVGPHAGAVDDDGGRDLGALAGLDVLDEGADDALARRAAARRRGPRRCTVAP